MSRSLCIGFVTVLCSLCAVERAARREAPDGRLRAQAAGRRGQAHARGRRRPPRALRSTRAGRSSASRARARTSSAGSSRTSRAWPRAAPSSSPRGSPRCSSRCAATSSTGARSRCSAPARASSFPGSELVFQYYAGHGLQIQWLGTFGKLNGYWSGGKRYDARAGALLDEAHAARHRARRRARVGVPVPVRRPGAAVGQLARPGHGPAGDGALGHAAAAPGRDLPGRAARPRHLPDRAARRACAWSPARARTTCSTRACRGLRSSTASSSRSSASTTSPQLTGDATARELFDAGDLAAKQEVPTFDTGAWSLYSRGSIKKESDLGYHKLLRDFLAQLCKRTAAEQYCSANAALHRVPDGAAGGRGPAAHARPKKSGKLRFKLSKISRVSVRITQGTKLIATINPGVLYRGTKTLAWTAPKKSGDYGDHGHRHGPGRERGHARPVR